MDNDHGMRAYALVRTPHQKIPVNVTEVGRRFREERRTVVKGLELLSTQGRA